MMEYLGYRGGRSGNRSAITWRMRLANGMTDDDWEWKDWVWIKAQWRDRRPFWVSVALGVISGLVPVVPIWISKGGGHRFYAGRVPLFLYDFMFFPTWLSPFLILAYIAAFGYLGPFPWRTVRRLYR